jgi:ferrous iron transport protein B
MMDIAEQRGITIDVSALSQQLGCPVLPIQAHKATGLDAVQYQLRHLPSPARPLPLNFSPEIRDILNRLQQDLLAQGCQDSLNYYYALRQAESGECAGQSCQDLDIVLADARYQFIHDLVMQVQKKTSDASEHLTARLDRVVLHRFLALPVFLAMMYLMFLFAINVGGAFQDFFDISTDTVFVQGSAWLLQQWHAPNWLIAIVANGLGKGINTTLTFVPVIAAMFFFLSLLETSGYMARAAFVVDKAMRVMGLPGKSFVPMIVGFGCNVPAIMAARTLDSERDRLLTVMMSPFMSCSARLAIYAVFVAAFFPSGGQNIVFSLYLIGILMAILTGFLLRKTCLQGDAAPLILELPAYHRPGMKRLLRETSLRLRFFVWRAGKLIIPVCMVLGALNAITIDGGVSTGQANTQSLLSIAAQWLTPLFYPLGINADNWPATVGL